MTARLLIHRAGPQITVQDKGRPGFQGQGLSRGGAADRLALDEAAALLGGPVAALEMAGMGGRFEVTTPQRIALTGAPMSASIDGDPVAWHAVHALAPGQQLDIGPARAGVYGYLSFGGGLALPETLGAQSAHLLAGIGTTLKTDDTLPLATDPGGPVGHVLDVADRFSGGTLRVLPGPQTDIFADDLDRFQSTLFTRDPRANRQGVKMTCPDAGFAAPGGLNIVSEAICPGDIQIAGDGAPYVLLAECQTTGGYPRIGTVIPVDLPRVAQTPLGAPIRFQMVTLDEALAIEARDRDMRAGLRPRPLVRDPSDIRDLLRYNLISGVTAGDPMQEERWP